MIKKTITYTDYNGASHTQDYYFNLSKADLIEMELSVKDGFSNKLEAISKAKDQTEVIPILKDVISRSVGVKSDDGKRFVRNNDIRDDFMQSEAYSELLVELLSDEKNAADFMNGLVNTAGGANTTALPPVKQDTNG